MPNEDQMIEIIKKSTRGFSFSKKSSFQHIADLAKGLSNADITKACEETIKEMILSGNDKLGWVQLEKSIEKRKY